MSETIKTKDNRGRNFATIVYPESAPENWQSILSEQFIPAFISPLHDKDVNPTGEPKKPHYHVILMYEGKKTLEQVAEVIEKIGGVGIQYIASLRAYSRYLCHLDNAEKAQYDIEQVRAFGGADYNGIIGTASDKYKAIGEMIDFCSDNDIVSFSVLLEYCREHRFDWFRILCDNGTVVMREYLKSKHWTKETFK